MQTNIPIPTGVPSLNPQMMIDNFKSMVMTMTMLKGTNQTDSTSSMVNTIIIMFVISFIDTFVLQVKRVISILTTKFENYITNKTSNINLISNLTCEHVKVKKSSVIIKIENPSKTPTADAVIDLLTLLPHTKCILLQNGIYSINYSEEIEVAKGLYAQFVNNSASNMTLIEYQKEISIDNSDNSNNSNKEQPKLNIQQDKNEYGYIDIYSYTMDMDELRVVINNIVKNYLIKMTNKLGNNIYYFSETPLILYRDSNGRVDSSKMPENLHFTMKPFVTNRSFKNLFGKDINIIRKRVEFFKDNKSWYDNKGVPYTLGILVSGNPGSGKTSLIKCIANELKRHIINIHLNDSMTKTQIENLFYNEQISVTQNGRTETYTIPIDKRIYVLEDVDCQCEIILDRGDETVEQVLAKKNAELKEEINRLQYALSELSNGRKTVMSGGKMPELDVKKEDIEKNNQKITLSFLLNLFDGVLETPGRITFMTTNFVDKLDKAFTRPGRIDIISKFGFTNQLQLIEIIEHRYDVKLDDIQLNIISNLPQCITPAEVSRILFENFDNLNGALEGLVNYANEYSLKDILKKEKDEELQKKVKMLEDIASVSITTTETDKEKKGCSII